MHKQTTRPMRTDGAAPLQGRARVPGDKSISHRALIFGALASGRTRVSGLLQSADVLATADVLRALGARIERDGDDWLVAGLGVGGLQQPSRDLDFGNSGTSVRLMMGVIAGHDITARLVGDASLSKRPMGRVLTPLRRMGLDLPDGDSEQLPLTIRGNDRLTPIAYELPVASAQVKSAILLAGLMTPGRTEVIEPKATRDHTERMMRAFGADIEIAPMAQGGGRRIAVNGPAELAGCDVIVPGDPSSAAFPVAAALIVPGSELVVENILINKTRTGFYTALKEMGADLRFVNERDVAGEPVADIEVRHSPLTGVTVPPSRAPSMIDEYPMLAALAAYATGETRMEGLEELRVKESDRLAATKAGLDAAGVTSEIEGDSLIVRGRGEAPGGGVVETHLDHRMAMSFLTLGLGAKKPMQVDDVSMIDTSFPNFIDLMNGLGARFEPVR